MIAEKVGDFDHGAGALVRAEGRSSETVAFEREVVSFFVIAAELLGIPRSVAAIYGICFASPVPLTFSEIQTRLNISAGSISQGLKVLREVGGLKVASFQSSGIHPAEISAGYRSSRGRERFEPDMELRKLVARFVEQRLRRQLMRGSGALQAMARQVPIQPHCSNILNARINALRVWHEKADAALPIIRSFLV